MWRDNYAVEKRQYLPLLAHERCSFMCIPSSLLFITFWTSSARHCLCSCPGSFLSVLCPFWVFTWVKIFELLLTASYCSFSKIILKMMGGYVCVYVYVYVCMWVCVCLSIDSYSWRQLQFIFNVQFISLILFEIIYCTYRTCWIIILFLFHFVSTQLFPLIPPFILFKMEDIWRGCAL